MIRAELSGKVEAFQHTALAESVTTITDCRRSFPWLYDLSEYWLFLDYEKNLWSASCDRDFWVKFSQIPECFVTEGVVCFGSN